MKLQRIYGIEYCYTHYFNQFESEVETKLAPAVFQTKELARRYLRDNSYYNYGTEGEDTLTTFHGNKARIIKIFYYMEEQPTVASFKAE